MFKKRAVQRTGKSTIYRKAGEKKTHPLLAAGLDALLSYILLFLLTAGCALIYNSVFPSEDSKLVLFVCIGITEAVLFLLYSVPAIKKWAPFLTTVGFAVGFLLFREPIILGIRQCGSDFIQQLNTYYSIDLPLFKGVEETAPTLTAICFFTLLLLWWFVTALLRFQNTLLLSLPPLLFICGALLLGKAPGGLPLFMTAGSFFALLPFGSREGTNRTISTRGKASFLLTAAIALCFLLTNSYGRETSKNIIAMQPEMISRQRALEQQILEYGAIRFFGKTAGRVSNHTPQYQEKDVLSITTDLLPRENLYLRGYIGDTYQYGSWSNKSQLDFASGLSSLSYENQKNAGTYVLNLFYETQAETLTRQQAQYQIEYLDLEDDYAYFPYLTNLNAVSSTGDTNLSLPLEADAMVYRAGHATLTAAAVTPEYLLHDTAVNTGYTENKLLESYYEKYLTRYLYVPTNLPQLLQLGTKLFRKLQTDYHLEEPDNLAETKEIFAATLVREELFARTSYSLSLDHIPFDTDVLEYFLFDSKKGFCEHYASAGVLLLRRMGIPARYVTGYVVKPEDFVRVSDTSYTAAVKDSAAHAWAEVYIKHVGWVPVEMTKGSTYTSSGYEDLSSDFYEDRKQAETELNSGNSQALQNENVPEQSLPETEPETENNSVDSEPTDMETASPENEQPSSAYNGQPASDHAMRRPSDTDTREEREQENELFGTNRPTSENDAGNPVQEKNSLDKILIRFAPLFGILCAGICLGISGFFCYIRLDRRRTAAFQQKNYRKAVQEIAAYTTRLLWRKGIIKSRALDDKAYREALRQGLSTIPKEDLEAYFSAIERAAYSNEALEKADVVCCYRLYKKVKTLK